MVLVKRPEGTYHLFPPGNTEFWYTTKGEIVLGKDAELNLVQVDLSATDETMEGLLRRIKTIGVQVMVSRDGANRPVMEWRKYEVPDEDIERCAANNKHRREYLSRRAHAPSLPQALMALVEKLGVTLPAGTTEAAEAGARTKGR